MNKKEYITPSLRIVNFVATIQMLAGSTEDGALLGNAHSRRQETWDDDDEEEDTGGWFK